MLKSKLFTIITIGLALSFTGVQAQCYIKSSDQGDGNITYYIDPELVAQTDDMGVAFSVQMIANGYYLAMTVQFADKAVPLEEKVALELKNGYIIELDMYTIQVGSANGVELVAAVYFLYDEQIDYLKKSELKSIKFNTQKGKKIEMEVSSSADVLVWQLKCFGDSNR